MNQSDLRAELASAAPLPADAVDWNALHRRIMAAARRPWWSYTASWARAAVPLAVAASVIASVALATLHANEPTVFAGVSGDLSEMSFASIGNNSDASWLLDAAAGQ
jgi:negative regulator of sigma E activity